MNYNKCYAYLVNRELRNGVIGVCCHTASYIRKNKKTLDIFIEEYKNNNFNHPVCNNCLDYRLYNNGSKVTSLILSLGNDCNCDCVICSSDSKVSYHKENMDSIYELFSTIDLKDIETIVFKGGEIFVHDKELLELLKYIYIKNKNIKINLLTNGTFLNKDIFLLIKKFNKKPHITISVDHSSDLNHILRYNAKYSKILELTEWLNENSFEFGINITISIFNIYSFVDNIRTYIKDFNIKLNNINLNYVRSPRSFSVDKYSKDEHINILNMLNENYDTLIEVNGFREIFLHLVFSIEPDIDEISKIEIENEFQSYRNKYLKRYNLDINNYVEINNNNEIGDLYVEKFKHNI